MRQTLRRTPSTRLKRSRSGYEVGGGGAASRRWQTAVDNTRVSGGNGDTLGRGHRPDYPLLILSLLLLVIGVIVIYAIGPALAATHGNVKPNFYINRQLIAIALSLVVFWIVSRMPLKRWQQLQMPLLIAAAFVTLLAIVMPVSPEYPAHRWVRLGSFSFQSVELVKFMLLITLASFLARRLEGGKSLDFHGVIKPLLAAVVGIGAIVAGIQSDLGSAVVMLVMITAMAFTAGVPLKRILLIGGVIAVAFVLAIVATPYRRDRLATFLNPESDCQDSGYQACHAHIAVGSGGLVGQGLGNGAQAYGYLPEAENDSIFAIYAEKFGFVGVSVLLGIFIGFFARLRHIGERLKDPFARLIVVGVLAWIAMQAIMNIGAMLGVLPLKGITLPLVSYGGTSVIFVMAAIGLVFHVSRFTQYRVVINDNQGGGHRENTHDRRRVRGAYHPVTGGR